MVCAKQNNNRFELYINHTSLEGNNNGQGVTIPGSIVGEHADSDRLVLEEFSESLIILDEYKKWVRSLAH